MAEERMAVRLDELMERIRNYNWPETDRVVAIGRGGVLPGYLVSRWLDIPMDTLSFRFRDDSHKPVTGTPQFSGGSPPDCRGQRVLLCDDVANSGATLKAAAALLEGAQLTTAVISGNADISLYGPHDRCIDWPWSV